MKNKKIASSVIDRMNKNLDVINFSKDEDEVIEAKEKFIMDSEEFEEVIENIEDEVEHLNEKDDIPNRKTEEQINKDLIKEDKSTSLKNLKMLFGIIALLLLSIVGITIYKNLPKAEKQEEVVVADPNNFRITDKSEIDEDEAFEKIEDIQYTKEKNQTEDPIKEAVVETTPNNSNIEKYDDISRADDKYNKEHAELDRAIAELEGESHVNEVLGKKNSDSLSFLKRELPNNKNKEQESKNINKNQIINNNKSFEDDEVVNEFTRKNKIAKSNNEYTVHQGSVIPAIFLTEVNTDLPGAVLAQVRENIYDSKTGQHLLIPKGSKMYGRYESNVFKGQTRVFLVWDKISLPNGKYVELTEFHSTDNLGNSGVSDKTNNHTWSLIGNAILSSILNFTDTLASGVSFNVAGVNIGLNGQAKEGKEGSPFKEVTSHLVKREVDRQPTITIRRGFKFNIIVNGDLELEKYKY
ncbi:TrbI/VirB10 family protein [Streptobacillus felis]|uniref:TrbI/VirB10 family protein n=1 Tax=Streptobacillus felis TaxID=1384509 RepID=UPI00082B629A|nr:TrbI/VirB10 family protein [Streptobacillus felis]